MLQQAGAATHVHTHAQGGAMLPALWLQTLPTGNTAAPTHLTLQPIAASGAPPAPPHHIQPLAGPPWQESGSSCSGSAGGPVEGSDGQTGRGVRGGGLQSKLRALFRFGTKDKAAAKPPAAQGLGRGKGKGGAPGQGQERGQGQDAGRQGQPSRFAAEAAGPGRQPTTKQLPAELADAAAAAAVNVRPGWQQEAAELHCKGAGASGVAGAGAVNERVGLGQVCNPSHPGEGPATADARRQGVQLGRSPREVPVYPGWQLQPDGCYRPVSEAGSRSESSQQLPRPALGSGGGAADDGGTAGATHFRGEGSSRVSSGGGGGGSGGDAAGVSRYAGRGGDGSGGGSSGGGAALGTAYARGGPLARGVGRLR